MYTITYAINVRNYVMYAITQITQMRNVQLGKIKKSSWLGENNNYCFKRTPECTISSSIIFFKPWLSHGVLYAGNSKQN